MRIHPRYLTGRGAPDLSTTLLGTPISMPIITTPMAGHGLAHVSAEAGTAKGTAAANTLFVAPLLSNITMEEIAKARDGPKWFQIYLPADRGLARELLGRAKACGLCAPSSSPSIRSFRAMADAQTHQIPVAAAAGELPGARAWTRLTAKARSWLGGHRVCEKGNGPARHHQGRAVTGGRRRGGGRGRRGDPGLQSRWSATRRSAGHDHRPADDRGRCGRACPHPPRQRHQAWSGRLQGACAWGLCRRRRTAGPLALRSAAGWVCTRCSNICAANWR